MPACPAESRERFGGRVRHLAAEWNDRNRLSVDELLQPSRRARREIDRAPRPRFDQGRRADRALLGGDEIEQAFGVRLALDDPDRTELSSTIIGADRLLHRRAPR